MKTMMKLTHKVLPLLLALLPLAATAQESAADEERQKDKNHNLEVAKSLEILNTLYSQLDLFYVDSLNPGQTMKAAINGMLRSLDPYTEY